MSDFLQNAVRTFGIERESREMQAYLIARLCDNVAAHAYVEAGAKLPPEKRKEFEALLNGTSAEAIERFMFPHIGDIKTFMQSVAQKEMEVIQAQMHKAAE